MIKRIVLPALTAFLVGIALSSCQYEPKNLSPEQREGYKLYKVYCRQCHRLQKPQAQRAGDWPHTLDKMQRLMQEKKKKKHNVQVMTNEQKAKILIFLESQARR